MDAYGDGLPILLGYQARWNGEEADIAVCEKSRRIGLSWGDASESVIHAGEGAGNVYYMSYNKDMTETYIADCAEWAKRFNRAVSEVFEETVLEDEREILRFRIHFDSGKDIIALTSNPRVLRSKGKPRDRLLLDEAAFCDDLDELLKAAVAFTQWGGKVRIVSTHNGDDSPFNELVTDIRAGRNHYALHRVDLDDAIADGLARRICTVKGDRWYDGYAADWRDEQVAKYRSTDAANEELFCIPRRGGGAWLPRVLIESCMHDAPVLRFDGSADFNALPEPIRAAQMGQWLKEEVEPLLKELDQDRRHVLGGDFARTGDLSVYAPLAIGATLQRTCPFLVELRNVPHMQQVQVVRCLGKGLPRLSGGAFDATGNGSFVAEAAVDMFGSMMEPVVFNEPWYREHMPPYKAAFEDDKIRVPRSDDVLEDHRAFRLVRGVPRLPPGKTDRAGERHGDSGMALVLAWYASDNAHQPIEYESAGARDTVGALDGYVGQRGGGLFGGYV